MTKERVILIDGHNLLFRMFYGIPSSIKNEEGKEIKGVVGFIGSLKRLPYNFNLILLLLFLRVKQVKNVI